MNIIEPCGCGVFECDEVKKTKVTKDTLAVKIAELRLAGVTNIRINGVNGRKLLTIEQAFRILKIL